MLYGLDQCSNSAGGGNDGCDNSAVYHVTTSMTVDRLVGCGTQAFTYQGLYMGGDLELLNAPITKGLSLTVTGANFAPTLTDSTPSIRLADVICLTTVRLSPCSHVACLV